MHTMDIVIVLTSHDSLGTSGYKTGAWFDEFATPYFLFLDAGLEISIASPLGGPAPIDPRSDNLSNHSASALRFRQDRRARAMLSDTLKLDQLDVADFHGAFYAGGPGALWDLADNPLSGAIIATLLANNKPVALVGHGVGALRRAVDRNARAIVEGRTVTGPSNSEEQATGLSALQPFSLQDELIRLGGHYTWAPDGTSHVIRDGFLITGQNTASAVATARGLLASLFCAV